MHEQNNRLEEQYINQLKAKDKQIDELNDRLKEAHQLQLGLEQKLKMLPGPDKQLVDGETTDTSNTTTKEEKENVNKQKSPKKGLWQRLFG